jgi:hypothetical protein
MRRNTTIAVVILMLVIVGATFLQLVVMAPR